MKILVATDGSRAGRAALKFAADLTADHGRGELVVLTVCPGRASAGAGANGGGPLKHARRVLAAAARHLRSRGTLAPRFELIRSRSADEVPEAISRHADRLRADLVVVGSEGRDP